jgi:hypothetical protein
MFDRCTDCGAAYRDFRCDLPNAGAHLSAMIAASGRGLAAGTGVSTVNLSDTRGDGSHLTLATARRDLGRLKRAAWFAMHGGGRCLASGPMLAELIERPVLNLTDDDRDWNLRELIACLNLGDDMAPAECSAFDPAEFTSFAYVEEYHHAA